MQEQQEKVLINVYVIMPFSKTVSERTEDYWTEHFEHFIKLQVEEMTCKDPILNRFDWAVNRSAVEKGGPLNYEII